MTVWKTVLEETNRVGQQRLVGAETYLQDISESAKPLCTAKKQTAKKVRLVGDVLGMMNIWMIAYRSLHDKDKEHNVLPLQLGLNFVFCLWKANFNSAVLACDSYLGKQLMYYFSGSFDSIRLCKY